MGEIDERQGTDIVREKAQDARPQERMETPESFTAGGNTAAGGADVKATLHPGSALYRAVVLLFGMGGASLWTWSSASALDAIAVHRYVEVGVVFGPASAVIAGAGYLAFQGARRDAHRLYDPTAEPAAPKRSRQYEAEDAHKQLPEKAGGLKKGGTERSQQK